MAQKLNLNDVTSLNAAGMPIILRTTDSYGEIVAFQIAAYGGVMHSQKAGVLEMIAKVIANGTYSFSKEDIDQIFTESGAAFSIDASTDNFSLSLKCLRRFLPKLLPVVSEIIRRPLFDQKEIELANTQLINSLRGEQENPDSILSLLAHTAYFKGHPYYNRPAGYIETIPQITRDDLTSTLFHVFNKQNVLFSIVGNITQDQAAEMVTTYFGTMVEGKRGMLPSKTLERKANEVTFKKFESPTTYFMARFEAPSLDHKDYPALTLASQILDNKLFEEVRTKRALTYAVSTGLGMNHVNSGYLYVSSTNLETAIKVMFDEVKKMQTELIDAKTLELQVRKYLSSWYMARETSSVQAKIFINYELNGMGWEESYNFINRLERVTVDDLRRVMKDYYKDYTFAVVGPKEVDVKKAAGL